MLLEHVHQRIETTPEVIRTAILPVLKGLLCFLTTLPVGECEGRACGECGDCFAQASKHMHLFPLIGAFIGLVAGLFAWILLHVLPGLIAGVLTLGAILLITGIHHTDGLLDFGDGVMALGTPERKIEAMHDQQTGAAGLAIGLVTLGTTALSIAELGSRIIVQALVLSEVSAKLAMVVCAWVGRSAHRGLGERFVKVMHGRWRNLRLASALAISFVIAILLLSFVGIVSLIAGVATALAIVLISHRNFGGVTGDVMGATNELARMVSLVTILAVIRWV